MEGAHWVGGVDSGFLPVSDVANQEGKSKPPSDSGSTFVTNERGPLETGEHLNHQVDYLAVQCG